MFQMPGIKKFTLSKRKVKTRSRRSNCIHPLATQCDLASLKRLVSCPLPSGWTLIDRTSNIVLSKSVFIESEKQVATTFLVTVDENMCWNVILPQGSIMPKSTPVLSNFSQIIHNRDDVFSILHALDTSIICEGSNDIKFRVLKQWNSGKFLGRSNYYS